MLRGACRRSQLESTCQCRLEDSEDADSWRQFHLRIEWITGSNNIVLLERNNVLVDRASGKSKGGIARDCFEFGHEEADFDSDDRMVFGD